VSKFLLTINLLIVSKFREQFLWAVSNFFADVSSKIIALADPILSQPDMEREMVSPLAGAYITLFTIYHVLPDLPDKHVNSHCARICHNFTCQDSTDKHVNSHLWFNLPVQVVDHESIRPCRVVPVGTVVRRTVHSIILVIAVHSNTVSYTCHINSPREMANNVRQGRTLQHDQLSNKSQRERPQPCVLTKTWRWFTVSGQSPFGSPIHHLI
jgi:hypothetical protein